MKILLIEDQVLLSNVLSRALSQISDFEMVAISDKASEAVQLCNTYAPDIVIMEVFTRDGNGIEVTAQIKQQFPAIKVLILTSVEDELLVTSAFDAGADFFSWKNISIDELVELINNASRPYRIFPNTASVPKKECKFNALEVKIIHLLAQGKTAKEIAEALFLSHGTVRVYISRMYTTTCFKSRAQLVTYAMQMGLIENE